MRSWLVPCSSYKMKTSVICAYHFSTQFFKPLYSLLSLSSLKRQWFIREKYKILWKILWICYLINVVTFFLLFKDCLGRAEIFSLFVILTYFAIIYRSYYIFRYYLWILLYYLTFFSTFFFYILSKKFSVSAK